MLCHYFIGQIPRQDQDIVRTRCADGFGIQNRDPRTGREFALLKGIAVDRVVDEVGSDAAVVQQGVSLPWCAVANDRLACSFCHDQELQYLSLCLPNLLFETRITRDSIQSKLTFPSQYAGDVRRRPMTRAYV